jgi:hypothetical protein
LGNNSLDKDMGHYLNTGGFNMDKTVYPGKSSGKAILSPITHYHRWE